MTWLLQEFLRLRLHVVRVEQFVAYARAEKLQADVQVQTATPRACAEAARSYLRVLAPLIVRLPPIAAADAVEQANDKLLVRS